MVSPRLIPIASVFYAQGTAGGAELPNRVGCNAVGAGTGAVAITLLTPGLQGSGVGGALTDADLSIVPSPGTGSNANGGVCFGIAAGVSGQSFTVNAYQNTNAAVTPFDVNYSVDVFLRVRENAN